ncbi:MAG: penicillin acylase family protein [Gemmatimonadota bacterium]|nr:MAG: penicillin acylase family protein [Gemmatimonadota bacterium]
MAEREAVSLPGLEAPVEVIFDDRGVPHIFASTAEDAARALGHVVARDRLFQMEFRWRTAAGRMTELVGEDALDFDRYVRGLGLAWSAEREFAALDPNSPAAREIAAYAEGVNAWIDGLSPQDVPLEYRLLGARPSRWEPVYSVYLLKLMGWDLTYAVTTDLRRLRLQALVGKEAAAALAPVNSPIQQPIQPNGERRPRFDFAPIPPPGEPDRVAMRRADALQAALGPLVDSRAPEAEPATFGSNNWAVAPERTAGGQALLAGDPHLALTLPAIWYEVHLVIPGELDVYGVTIPSVPYVVIGFNRDVAWSFTNTGADVIDYYEEELDDSQQPSRHRVDDQWRPLEARVEEYRGHGGRLLATDTLRFTHRGPLITHHDRSLSMRWTVLEGAGETIGLRRAARARSVEEWLAAMEVYTAPAQNMILADRTGTIAIRSTGSFPLHPDGSGLEVRDGRMSASDWAGFWPVARYPFAIAPQQGYLASANQQPIDPRDDPTYLGADWPSPWRAIRINALLMADSTVTPDAMRRYQTEPGNARADLFLPFFLDAVRRQAAGEGSEGPAREAAELLAAWDRRYTKDNERAVLFEYAMSELANRTWDELLGSAEEGGRARRVYTPSSAVLASLIHQPESVWWDDRRTGDVVEDRDAILLASLEAALERVQDRYGEPDGGGWRWDKIRHANIYHLLELPALSALGLPVQGGPGNLNPSSGRGAYGASWRMVVELGPQVSAWSIYPGGQSGHPLSSRYVDRIDKWVAGELDPVLFPRAPSDLDDSRVASVLELEPER